MFTAFIRETIVEKENVVQIANFLLKLVVKLAISAQNLKLDSKLRIFAVQES